VHRGVPLAEVDIGLLAHEVGKAAPNALDGGQGVHDLVAPVHVRVQHTQDVLEALIGHQSLQRVRQYWLSDFDLCASSPACAPVLRSVLLPVFLCANQCSLRPELTELGTQEVLMRHPVRLCSNLCSSICPCVTTCALASAHSIPELTEGSLCTQEGPGLHPVCLCAKICSFGH